MPSRHASVSFLISFSKTCQICRNAILMYKSASDNNHEFHFWRPAWLRQKRNKSSSDEILQSTSIVAKYRGSKMMRFVWCISFHVGRMKRFHEINIYSNSAMRSFTMRGEKL